MLIGQYLHDEGRANENEYLYKSNEKSTMARKKMREKEGRTIIIKTFLWIWFALDYSAEKIGDFEQSLLILKTYQNIVMKGKTALFLLSK